jgi:hypothetical protein
MATGSVDQTQSYVFEVNPSQQADSASRTLCFWSIEGDNDSSITIWNYKAAAQDLVLTLYYFHGQYAIPIHLGPNETYNLDMASLVHSRAPDPSGTVIPSNITGESGSAVLTGAGGETDTISVAVSASVFNVRNATCGGQCVTCNGATEATLDPGSYAEAVGGTTQAQAQITWNSGNVYTNPSGATWYTANTPIATVSSTGMITGQAPGTTGVVFTIGDYPIYAVDCSNYEPCPYGTVGDGGPDTVPPQIMDIDPSIIPVGQNTMVTITGTGFGSYPTVNLPSGLTASNQNSSGNTITLTVTVPTNTVIGYDYISVTANGQTSDPPWLVVLDGPSKMDVVSDQSISGSPGSLICPTNECRTVQYQIVNFSGITAGETNLCETPSLTAWSCTQNPPGVSFQGCPSLYYTPSDGILTDEWTIGSGSYSPVGCGYTITDTWNWGFTSPPTPLGLLTGHIYTNAIQINGVTSPAQMPPGTVVPQ